MNFVALPAQPDNPSAADALIDIQLRVARRADALARRLPPDRAADRRLWLRAECEVFERIEQSERRAVSRIL